MTFVARLSQGVGMVRSMNPDALDPDDEGSEEVEAILNGINAQVESFYDDAHKRLRRIGVHIEGMQVMVPPVDPETMRPVGPPGVVLTCLLGEKAWSDEVQNPEAPLDPKQLEKDLLNNEFDSIRAHLQAEAKKEDGDD